MYVIKALQTETDTFLTVNTIFSRLRSSQPPRELAFPSLPGVSTPLVTDAGAPIDFRADDTVVRAVGLSTCASICFVNAAKGKGYVYHGNAGTISSKATGDALQAIEATDPDYLYIVLAHVDGPSGYEMTLERFQENLDLPGDHLLEITHLRGTSFGLNSMLQLGY